MEYNFLILIQIVILELEAYPTPKRPQNWNKEHSRVLPVQRHIPLSQEIVEVSQCLPSSIQTRKRLADGQVQIGVELVSGLAECIQTRK